ncbi:peptidase S41, partial [Cyanobium sp. N5-Cardenillas]|nr:peptidase S41 [Cyanobium sp. N5-Cardenillas]
PVKMTEQEVQRLKLEDIGTNRDSQYRAAESTLRKQLQASTVLQKAFQPGSANLPAALAKP